MLFERDFVILFVTRSIRMFSYGWISVILLLFLQAIGWNSFESGILISMTLIGDIIMTFILSTKADYFGRRKTLIMGAMLALLAGVIFALSRNFFLLVFAAIVGVITPTGGEIGPFLAVEQAALLELLNDKKIIAKIFGWYNFVGYLFQALGALSCGWFVIGIQIKNSVLISYQLAIIGYSIFAIINMILYYFLTIKVETNFKRSGSITSSPSWCGQFGLHHPESKFIVFRLSALFLLDAFAGGFVIQTLIVYWFHTKFNLSENLLGIILMCCNVVAGISSLLATPLVNKIGAINTMVITHLPSGILLLLIPFMPSIFSASLILILRFCISQMDQPARQTYYTLMVADTERSATGGILKSVRSIGASVSPLIASEMILYSDSFWFNMPFITSAIFQITYDLLLYLSFRFRKETTNNNQVSGEEEGEMNLGKQPLLYQIQSPYLYQYVDNKNPAKDSGEEDWDSEPS